MGGRGGGGGGEKRELTELERFHAFWRTKREEMEENEMYQKSLFDTDLESSDSGRTGDDDDDVQWISAEARLNIRERWVPPNYVFVPPKIFTVKDKDWKPEMGPNFG
jgi:hypothetical protein